MEYKRSIAVSEDGTITYKRVAFKRMGGIKVKRRTIERRKVDGINLFKKLNLFVKKETSKISVLPERTRFFRAQGDYLVLVIEDAPQIRNTFWDWDTVVEEEYRQVARRKNIKKAFRVKSSRGLKKTTFQLAFPYVLYFLLFHKGIFQLMWLFYRTEPLRSEKDILLVPNLLNLGSSQRVCLGEMKKNVNLTQSISRQSSQIIQKFWNSEFNNDLTSEYYTYREEVKEFKTLWDWEIASRENPLFPLRVCWEGLYKTVEDVLAFIFRNYAKEREKMLLPSSAKDFFDFLTEAIFQTPPE